MKRKWIIAAACACALIFAGCSSDTATENAPEAVEEITITNEENVPTSYDCIVVDGSPEGVTAAISAARNGLETLPICQDEALGGLYTWRRSMCPNPAMAPCSWKASTKNSTTPSAAAALM